MPFNGSGVFNRVYNWVNDAANSINITASRVDTEDNGFATGLSNCVTRDGQSPWTANIPAGGFKITGLTNGSSSTDSSTVGQSLQVANNLSDLNNVVTSRSNLGVPLGTSGAVLGLLSTANTYSQTQTISVAGGAAGLVTANGSGSGTAVNSFSNDASKTAAVELFGSAVGGTYFGLSQNSMFAIRSLGSALGVGTGASGGNFVMGTNDTAQLLLTSGGGITTSGVTGGDKGAGTINATTLYQAGTALNSSYFQIANNLSEGTASTMRTNLGLGTAATQSTGTFAQVANNLSDVTAATAKTNLGISKADINLGDINATASSRVTGTHGLGGLPIILGAFIKNISGGTQNGYANGEYVSIYAGGTSRNDGCSVSATTTNVTINVGANGIMIIDAGTFNGTLVGGLGVGHWEFHVLCLRY